MKLKSLLLALSCLFFTTTIASAQEDINPVVVVSLDRMTYNPKLHNSTVGSVIGEVAAAVLSGQTSKEMEGYENAVQAAVIQGMSRSFRVKVVDGLTPEDLEYPHVFSVEGDITNMTTTSKTEVETYEVKGEKKTRSRTYYRGLLGVKLQIKDAHNSAVIASPSFDISAMDLSWIETPAGAMNNALEVLSKKVRNSFNNLFPLTGSILERAGEKNDKQKEVYIDLGSNHGITEGQVLGVYRLTSIAGKTARREIARLKVKRVEGEEVSFCKVISHGKDLKAALDAGDTIVIETL